MDFLHKSHLFGGIEMQENSKMYLTVQIRCDLRSPVQVGIDTMTTFNRNDIY
jgi:hypothetical protein